MTPGTCSACGAEAQQNPLIGHHPDCALGDTDHPGYLEYRCIDDQGRALPFPGEDNE